MDHILEHIRGKCGYNAKGEEIPDPKPTALQIDLEVEMPLELKVMRALQSVEWQKRMEAQGLETFEEANDFEVPLEESEFKTFHEDESGDVLAFEEGVKRGFIEEIPEKRKEEAKNATGAARDYMRSLRKTPSDARSSEPNVPEVLEKVHKGELK